MELAWFSRMRPPDGPGQEAENTSGGAIVHGEKWIYLIV
jgi:hypothetical protein